MSECKTAVPNLGALDSRWIDQHNRQVQECSEREPELLLIGDSIIQKMVYHDDFYNQIAQFHPLNLGIGGDKTQNVLWRLQNGNLNQTNPRAIVLHVGTNNPQPAKDVAEGIVEIVHELIRVFPKAHIIVWTHELDAYARPPMNGRERVASVSDLYISDEISVLLEEIQSLEPSSYRPEDIQDFEIAGSQTGGRTSSVAELETPGATTVHSWDSHANYRQRASPTRSIYEAVVVYCDHTHVRSTSGLIRALLVATSLLVLLCLCTSGTFRLGLFVLPLLGRIRFMMFVATFSFLITSLSLFLDITHIVYLFPFNWGKINAFLYVSISVLFMMCSSLVIHQVYAYEKSYTWVPKGTRTQLFVTGVLGFVCALESLLLALLTRCDEGQYRPVTDEPSLSMQERKVIRYTPSPCPSLQPAMGSHWTQDTFPSSRAKE